MSPGRYSNCWLPTIPLANIKIKYFLFFLDSGSESGSHKGGGRVKSGGGGGSASGDGKPTRVRTVLNEKQLHTLRTCYAANPRPDALMKEQLVEMTGLSPRVIRVWFQNKRCKDKKKTILMKQQMQQEKVGKLYILEYNFEFCNFPSFSTPVPDEESMLSH